MVIPTNRPTKGVPLPLWRQKHRLFCGSSSENNRHITDAQFSLPFATELNAVVCRGVCFGPNCRNEEEAECPTDSAFGSDSDMTAVERRNKIEGGDLTGISALCPAQKGHYFASVPREGAARTGRFSDNLVDTHGSEQTIARDFKVPERY